MCLPSEKSPDAETSAAVAIAEPKEVEKRIKVSLSETKIGCHSLYA